MAGDLAVGDGEIRSGEADIKVIKTGGNNSFISGSNFKSFTFNSKDEMSFEAEMFGSSDGFSADRNSMTSFNGQLCTLDILDGVSASCASFLSIINAAQIESFWDLDETDEGDVLYTREPSSSVVVGGDAEDRGVFKNGSVPKFTIREDDSVNSGANLVLIQKNPTTFAGNSAALVLSENMGTDGEERNYWSVSKKTSGGTDSGEFELKTNNLDFTRHDEAGHHIVMSLTEEGNVGMGTTDPRKKLDINTGVAGDSDGVLIRNNRSAMAINSGRAGTWIDYNGSFSFISKDKNDVGTGWNGPHLEALKIEEKKVSIGYQSNDDKRPSMFNVKGTSYFGGKVNMADASGLVLPIIERSSLSNGLINELGRCTGANKGAIKYLDNLVSGERETADQVYICAANKNNYYQWKPLINW